MPAHAQTVRLVPKPLVLRTVQFPHKPCRAPGWSSGPRPGVWRGGEQVLGQCCRCTCAILLFGATCKDACHVRVGVCRAILRITDAFPWCPHQASTTSNHLWAPPTSGKNKGEARMQKLLRIMPGVHTHREVIGPSSRRDGVFHGPFVDTTLRSAQILPTA